MVFEIRVSTSANRHAAAILSAILFIVRPTKPIIELGREFHRSNPYMKFGRNPMKSVHINRVTINRTDRRADGRTDGQAETIERRQCWGGGAFTPLQTKLFQISLPLFALFSILILACTQP